MGYGLDSIHEARNPIRAVREAEAIFIGGGNTFVLLENLQKRGLIPEIKKKIRKGIPYIGSSAGSNLAGPTIMTTNDMPIREIKSLKAFNIVPFQINPHFIDHDPKSKMNVESRATRLQEFHEFNETPVVGIREGSFIRLADGKCKLRGTTGAVIFRKNKKPRECKANCSLDFLF